MKLTLEIEYDDEKFSLNDLDWFMLEGGTFDKTENGDEKKTKLFTFFKCVHLKVCIICTMTIWNF